MLITIIDGQGGGIGRTLVERVKSACPNAKIVAVGTNSTATFAMMKAGADDGATGENAAVFNCARADVIMGPIGILLTNGMLGEITSKIACAVSGSSAQKILIPISKCHVHIAGCEETTLSKYMDDAVCLLTKIIANQ